MATPLPEPPAIEPKPWVRTVLGFLKLAVGLVVVAAVSAGAAWLVFDWRIQQTNKDATEQVAALRQELRAQQDQLTAKVQQVQTAAEEARLLMSQNGQTTTLQARLNEIDTIKLDLQKTQEELNSRAKSLEQSISDQIAKQSKETAQALSLEMRWKSLVIKAQGEILLAQVRWAEGNRGLAKDELGIATRTLQQALEEAPESNKATIKSVLDLSEQAKSALILEQTSARDALNLLWHRVSDLLIPGPKS